MNEIEEKTELEIMGEQALKDIQNMIEPKWNIPHRGNADGPLNLQLINVRSLYKLSKVRRDMGYDEDTSLSESGPNYATLCDSYKKAYDNFFKDLIFLKNFLTIPYGQIDIENYINGFSNDELRTKNFKAIIHNLLVRIDMLALNLNLMDQIYRVHVLANTRGKKTRERKGKKSPKCDK
jgi:hypothetical protein